MRIIFFGTPGFAVPSLQAIIKAGFDVVAVVTAVDKPAGRGLEMRFSAVKDFALQNNLPVLQPVRMKSTEFVEQLQKLKADLQVVIAFRMMPEVVWAMPPLGTMNLHASLLPQYRGAAPINRAIMNGETQTGLTTFFLKHQIDTGNILMQQPIAIGPDETAGQLHDRMMEDGAALVVKSLNLVQSGNFNLIPQNERELLVHAPKIFKEDCRIDWHQTSNRIYNQVRGLSPYPAAFTTLQGMVLRIFRCQKLEGATEGDAGTVESDGKAFLHVHTGDGALALTEVQLEGKKRMPIADFLNGYKPGSGLAGH